MAAWQIDIKKNGKKIACFVRVTPEQLTKEQVIEYIRHHRDEDETVEVNLIDSGLYQVQLSHSVTFI